ncbi:MAG TPA: hypothetical protein VE263_07320 [Candidatus Angelobacter sp.]|nr:hypothetical protein [Candidatus Angelobacter sp.]
MNVPMDDLTPEEKELLRGHGDSLEALRARHADCPRLEILLALQAGVLPEEKQKSVAVHLEKCAFCKVLLEDLASEEMTSATGEEAIRMRARVLAEVRNKAKSAKAGGGWPATWFWKAIPVTALAGAAIALLLWIRLHPTVTPASPEVVMQPTPKPLVPSSLQWEKLPIRLQAQSILVWRGKPRTAQERYAAELTAALAFYRDDKYAEATERLAKVVKDFPRGVEGQLYLGISDLKTDRDSDAVGPLQAARQLGPEQFRDDARWYLAIAYARTNNLQSTVAELQGLCQGKSDYASRACTAAKELSLQLQEKPGK